MDAKHDTLTVTPMLRNSGGQDTGLEFRLHSVHREAVLACFFPMAVDFASNFEVVLEIKNRTALWIKLEERDRF